MRELLKSAGCWIVGVNAGRCQARALCLWWAYFPWVRLAVQQAENASGAMVCSGAWNLETAASGGWLVIGILDQVSRMSSAICSTVQQWRVSLQCFEKMVILHLLTMGHGAIPLILERLTTDLAAQSVFLVCPCGPDAFAAPHSRAAGEGSPRRSRQPSCSKFRPQWIAEMP